MRADRVPRRRRHGSVPIRLELVVKKNGKRIRDLEAHLWTFGANGLVTRLRHLLDSHQWVLATQA